MQVPRVVEKRTPYAYTVRSPRTIVTKVPLDACGNPLPVPPAPAAAARPTLPVPPPPAPAPFSPAPVQPSATPAPIESGPVKTFSDKPADAAPPTAEGCGSSTLDHVAPEAADARQAVRAEKPAAEELKPVEAIPAPVASPEPAAVAEPTIAPPGPAVFPPPPASDPRDVPAAKTSGPALFRSSGPLAHTT
jgi:hypothetical protein